MARFTANFVMNMKKKQLSFVVSQYILASPAYSFTNEQHVRFILDLFCNNQVSITNMHVRVFDYI